MKCTLLAGVLLLLSCGAAPLHAQYQTPEWGEVSEAEWALAAYPADTNATALILADYGNVYLRDWGDLVFERHTRVKLLSEAGYEWATVSVPYDAEDGAQRVKDVRGHTLTRGPGGKVTRQKLDKDAVFTEEIDGKYKRVRFTLPALEPGAIVEYSYAVHSDDAIFLPSWDFQTSEPTLWSEYRLRLPETISYVVATRGVLSFHKQEMQEITRPEGDEAEHRWVMRDVAALRDEPFMTTPEDHRARMQFQLASIYHPSVGRIEYLSSWEKLAKELMDASWFGKQLQPGRKVRERVEGLTAGTADPLARLQAVYDDVRTNVTLQEGVSWLVEQEVDDVLKTKRGTSGEMALLLVAMLRAAGLEAHPVLISTRSHGKVMPVYPLLSQFNDLLVYAVAGDKTYLLDATDPVRPYDLLPTESINGSGWLVREDAPSWIPVKATGIYRHQVVLDAGLDASGTLTARLQTADVEYSALDKRHGLKAASSPEAFVREEVLEGRDEMLLESFRFAKEDSLDAPFEVEAAVSIPAYAQAAGDFLYFNPIVLGRVEENPLRLPERTFPVDLAYPRDFIYTMNLRIPEGYAVQELPVNIRVKLPEGNGTFQRLMEEKNGVLTVQSRFQLKRDLFPPEMYQELRQFYEQVVASGAQQVVLRRSSAPAEAVPASGGGPRP